MDSSIRWIVLVVGLILAGCGGGGGTDYPPSRPSGSVSGVAHDGRIAEGNLRIYSFADGARGALLGSATTDEEGVFSVDFAAQDQPVLLEIDGGRYVEEATGTLVRIKSGKGLKAYAMYSSAEQLVVNVTPLSLLAAGLVEYKVSTGVPVAEAISQANAELLDIFGVEVTATIPRDLRVAGEPGDTIDESTLYGFILASFSSYTAWLTNKNEGSLHEDFPSIALARLMYDDIRADGILDGLGAVEGEPSPAQLTFAGAELNQNIYRSAIAQHMLVTASSAANQTGIKAQDLVSAATSFASSSAPIFPGSNSASLDLEGPVITPVDGLGIFYSRVIQYRVDVSDQSALGTVSFALDGVTLGEAADVNDPVIAIDTTQYDDGIHTLDVTAFDDVGNLGSESFSLLFDNTKPVINVTSAGLTNQSRFKVTGTYEKTGSEVTFFQVQGADVKIAADNTWNVNVSLSPGQNVIPIVIRDSANNTTEQETIVALDKVPPNFTGSRVTFSESALFDLGNATCYVASLDSASSGPPLYFNRKKASVSSVIPKQRFSWFDLQVARVPFLRFYVLDTPVSGVSTPASQISVRMQYSINDGVLVPFKALTVHDDPNATLEPYFLIPLASDYLHPDWTKSTDQDVHKIAIKLTDKAGNTRDYEFTFRAVFGDSDCTVL